MDESANRSMTTVVLVHGAVHRVLACHEWVMPG
jgi:hypothetical protein